MAMHVEKYTTKGEAIPAATRLFRIIRLLAVILVLFLVRRGDGSRSAFLEAGEVRLIQDEVRVTTPVQPGIQWGKTGHFIQTASRLIYLDAGLKPEFRTNFQKSHRFIASAQGFMTYRKIGKGVTAYSRQGERRFFFPTRAYPRLAAADFGLTFLLTGDQSGIGFLRGTGHLSGAFQHIGTLITSFGYNPAEASVYFGQVSGHLEKFQLSSGKTLWRKKAGGSKVAVIKGLSVSKDGNAFAVVSGLYPERFSLLDPAGATLWSVKTGGNVKTMVTPEVGVAFCAGYSDTRMYLLRRSDGERVYTSHAVERTAPIRFLDMASTPDGERTLVAWGNKELSRVMLVNRQGRMLYYRVFASPFAFVRFSACASAFSVQTSQGIQLFSEGELL